MKKWLVSLFIVFAVLAACQKEAKAQTGFNPEFLGNADAPQMQVFCIKFFTSYFHQNSISGHDVEVAFEPQVFIAGFSGDPKKDQIQFIAHLPMGYRRQNVGGQTGSVTGIGTLFFNAEHFWHLIDEEDMEFWFDNALSFGFPTATEHRGITFAGNPYIIGLGADTYSVGYFQENFFRYRRFLASIMPVNVSYAFRDDKTNVRSGLSLGLVNSSVGYKVSDIVSLGVNFGILLGNVVGSDNNAGGGLPRTFRAYVGPAALFAFKPNLSWQIGVAVDVATKNAPRGQGIFSALWHHF